MRGKKQHRAFVCILLKPAISRDFRGVLHFIDEPTNGLDEESVKQLHKIILEEKERGAIIVIASHSKEDIEELCDITFMMKNGKIEKRSVE